MGFCFLKKAEQKLLQADGAFRFYLNSISLGLINKA